MIDLWEHWDLIEHVNSIYYYEEPEEEEIEKICDDEEETDSEHWMTKED